MPDSHLTPEQEKVLIEAFFEEIRLNLKDYFKDRRLVLSNSQLFAFVLISPITIAIASDGNLDFTETTMLVDIASYFERDILPKELDQLKHPKNALTDKEFRRVIYSELRYLCLSMDKYEAQLLKSIQSLIRLDEKVSREKDPRYSIKRRVIDMMNGVIYNNMGADSVEEQKIHHVLKQLGLKA